MKAHQWEGTEQPQGGGVPQRANGWWAGLDGEQWNSGEIKEPFNLNKYSGKL